jgi:hypothetical protein
VHGPISLAQIYTLELSPESSPLFPGKARRSHEQLGLHSHRIVGVALYSGEIPVESVTAEFSAKFGTKIDVLENMENEAAA